jgi:hypothetical protein
MEISTPVEETKQEGKREETVAKQNSSRDAATVKGVFPCTECDFVATTSLGLSKHMVSKHGALSKKDKKRLRDEEKINDDHDNTIELINAKVKDVEPPTIAPVAPTAAPPPLKRQKNVIDPGVYAEKEKALQRLKAVEAKFGEDLNWKCELDINTPLPKLKSELSMVMELCSARCGCKILYDTLLMVGKGLEQGSQIEPVKQYLDLDGYPIELEKNKKEITEILGEILNSYPDMTELLKPELRLFLVMGGAAVVCASNNQQKKNVEFSVGPPTSQ